MCIWASNIRRTKKKKDTPGYEINIHVGDRVTQAILKHMTNIYILIQNIIV